MSISSRSKSKKTCLADRIAKKESESFTGLGKFCRKASGMTFSVANQLPQYGQYRDGYQEENLDRQSGDRYD